MPKRVHFITDWSTSPSIALHKSSLRCSYVRLLAHCAGQAKTHTSLISYLPVRTARAQHIPRHLQGLLHYGRVVADGCAVPS